MHQRQNFVGAGRSTDGKFPCSGEINRKVEDSAAVLAAIEAEYAPGGHVDKLDGLSIDYAEWRFNVRVSNTEPVMRLNVETRGDKSCWLKNSGTAGTDRRRRSLIEPASDRCRRQSR